MARLKSYNCADGLKPFAIFYYMWLELCVWCFMTYTSVYYGKIFDYRHFESADFAEEIGKGDNLYYRLMFGSLNLTSLDGDERRQVQEKCDTLNTLFVFVFISYSVFSIFFLLGSTKKLGSKCLLTPYVSFDISVLLAVMVFVVYGAVQHIEVLDRNGSFFLLIKLAPSLTILSYYRSLSA